MSQLCRDYSGEWITWHREAQAKGHAKTLSSEAITLYHRIKLQGTPKYTLGSNCKVPQSILSDQTAEYVTFSYLSIKFYPSVLIKLSLI